MRDTREMKPFRSQETFLPNGEGWELEVSRSWNPRTLESRRRPVLMVPGFGNNKSVFSFPDDFHSWESNYVKRGYEVWTVNLRGQGNSKFLGRRNRPIGIRDLAVTDLNVVFDYIIHNTLTDRKQVDVIGASLGAAVMYVHAVLNPNNYIGSMVAVGGPFRWEQCHPVVSLAMSRPRLVGMIPVKGSRTFLKHAFPLLRRFPIFIKQYIQPDSVAGDNHDGLLPAVDDPCRNLARQLAEWINAKDLVVDGTNITQGLKRVTNPLLCATGNNDGIVPPATSLAAIAASGSKIKEVLWIGDDQTPFGHTDPMIHRESPERVFEPIAKWLDRQH